MNEQPTFVLHPPLENESVGSTSLQSNDRVSMVVDEGDLVLTYIVDIPGWTLNASRVHDLLCLKKKERKT